MSNNDLKKHVCASNKRKSTGVKDYTYCALFTTLICVGAFIKIPIPVVPFTLQFLFTMLAGIVLGRKLGAFSVFIYMMMGLLGVPVFASGGGFGYVLVPSFGYIPGFILGTYITGLMIERMELLKFGKILFANFVGLMTVYIVGMIYYYVISNYVINTPIGLWPLFLYCFILAVPGDIFLCFVGAVVGKRLILLKRSME